MTQRRRPIRCFLAAVFAVALFLPAVGRSQSADPPKSGESIRLPFVYAAKRKSLVVQVWVNGKRTLLILDTGSAHTVLRPEVVGVKRKELIPARFTSDGGWLGDAVGKEVTLQVGDRVWPKYRIAVMDLSQVLAVYQEDLDGVLGLDFLENYRQITIDLRERTVILSR